MKDITFKTIVEEDQIEIKIMLKNVEIGHICAYQNMIETFIEDELEYFYPTCEPEEKALFDALEKEVENADCIFCLSSFDIIEEHRRDGYGKALFAYAMDWLNKEYSNPLKYLNACPIKYEVNGRNLSELVSLYSNFGFEPYLNQYTNVLMIEKSKKD